MNLEKFITKVLNGIEITGVTKDYNKGLLLIIHYKIKDNIFWNKQKDMVDRKEYSFTIKLTDKCRKQVAYILSDVVKMNVTAKDLKGL